jgi:hypothetical protein
MQLLPSSLAVNHASQRALCEALSPHHELAKRLNNATVESLDGTWTDALRTTLSLTGDLPVAAAYPSARKYTNEVQTIAVAKPLAATLGLTDLSVLDDEQVRLNDEDSRALCEAANEHLVQDGVSLQYVDASTWFFAISASREVSATGRKSPSPAPAGHPLPEGEGLLEVLTEYPTFLVGENLRQFLPRGRDARIVERWMNELQMLFFNHPVNAARQASGLPPINFVWLYGFSRADAEPMAIELPTTLFFDALKRGDVAAWQAAWTTLEPEIMRASGVILGDAFPRLKLTFGVAKKPGLFSWFAKKPTLAEVLMRVHETAFDASPSGRGRREALGEG